MFRTAQLASTRLTFRTALLMLLATYAPTHSAASRADVVLTPPPEKAGNAVALFFAQGASIKPSQYITLAKAIQDAVPFPLYVAIPECPADAAAIPSCLQRGYARTNASLVAAGMDASAPAFYAGHSLGGAMTPDFVVQHAADSAAGVVLLGAFLTRKWKLSALAAVDYPVPTLTVGGTLDGLCRVTRVAEAAYSQHNLSADPRAARRKLPVTVVEGLSHMQFADGEPPSFVFEHDLLPELTYAAAHAAVASDVALFMRGALLDDAAAWAALDARQEETARALAPLQDMLELEAYIQFKPPCYCETNDEYGAPLYGTCADTAACAGGVPFISEHAQPKMGAGQGIVLVGASSTHRVTEENPSAHLPHIHGSQYGSNTADGNPGNGEGGGPALCGRPDACTLNVSSVVEHKYDNSGEADIWRVHFGLDTLDTGFLPIAASELKTKLKSRQALWQAANVSAELTAFEDTDQLVANGGAGDRCGEIVELAITLARDAASARALERHDAHGVPLAVGRDRSTCAAGPCWIWDPLRFDDDDENATVSSVAFPTENKNNYPCGEEKLLPCDAGFHYCKLLSPARAIEWIYVDGLRAHYSLKSNQTRA